MAKLTLKEAAAITGFEEGRIWKQMTRGWLMASRNANGEWVIEEEDLFRIFPPREPGVEHQVTPVVVPARIETKPIGGVNLADTDGSPKTGSNYLKRSDRTERSVIPRKHNPPEHQPNMGWVLFLLSLASFILGVSYSDSVRESLSRSYEMLTSLIQQASP
jgi:hypothetical protein